MSEIWKAVFDNYGIKKVTKTDKAKGAYVPNRAQLKAIAAAGILPSRTRPAEEFTITVLQDPVNSVAASYYNSNRETDPTRQPEPRMGHAFISRWLLVGDDVVLGNIGHELFAAKITPSTRTSDQVIEDVAKKASKATVMAKAKKAKGKPLTRVVPKTDFVRNPYVIQGALLRSKGKCEMPTCTNMLFLRESGEPYLEVHHILPLAEGGDDSLANAAALCPHCHREVHLGKRKHSIRKILAEYIASIPND